VIITNDDCGTVNGIVVRSIYEGDEEVVDLGQRIIGRVSCETIADPVDKKKKIVKANQYIDERIAAELQRIGVEQLKIRSVLTCECGRGVCAMCYGRNLATGDFVKLGEAVGIIAAQSIGEPGTQLTMRTFHTGGVAGADITHGLPRVVELFEARKPKAAATLSEIGGRADVEEADRGYVVTVTEKVAKGEDREPVVKEYSFPRRTRLRVTKGEVIEQGTPLNEGPMAPSELLDLRIHDHVIIGRQRFISLAQRGELGREGRAP